MTIRKLTGPQHKAAGMQTARPAQARAGIEFRIAAAKDCETIPLTTCNPHGQDEASLHNHIISMEAELRAVAATHSTYSFSTGELDKANQNAMNHLGDPKGAGDAAINAHWDVARKVITLVSARNGSDNVDFTRVNEGSDESVFTMSGRHLDRRTAKEFAFIWEAVKEQTDLRQYAYRIEVPYKGVLERFDLDLHAFSQVLRYPKSVLAYHLSVSQPRRIDPHGQDGFIADEIRKLANREAHFFARLPKSMQAGGGGRPEVITPFTTSLEKMGISQRDHGTFVELKLAAEHRDSLELLRFVKDCDGRQGTRKGFAEIFSDTYGMRGCNTFFGKARCNSTLTPLVWAMHDVAQKATVLPINGSYLQYWVNLPPTEETRQLIAAAVANRIHTDSADPRYANIGLEPSVTCLDASSTRLADAKARFILASLGKAEWDPKTLYSTDFLLNFVEYVRDDVQIGIYSKLKKTENGGNPVRKSDLEHIQDIRHVCATHRTVRNTEDLVWILRKDENLPDQIKARKGEIESWLFEFASTRFEPMFRLLAQKIREIKECRK